MITCIIIENIDDVDLTSVTKSLSKKGYHYSVTECECEEEIGTIGPSFNGWYLVGSKSVSNLFYRNASQQYFVDKLLKTKKDPKSILSLFEDARNQKYNEITLLYAPLSCTKTSRGYEVMLKDSIGNVERLIIQCAK